MNSPREKAIRDLHRWTDVPEEELRTLTAEQIEDVMEALSDLRSGLLSGEEVIDRLTDDGFFDLPSLREEQRRYIEAYRLAEVRALVDLLNAQCLQRGEPEKMIEVAKEDDGGYPPARSN